MTAPSPSRTVTAEEAYRLGYDSGWLDAEKVWLERAAPASSAGLDVERLARALPAAFAQMLDGMHVGAALKVTHTGPNPDVDRRWAEAIAREYAALATSTEEPRASTRVALIHDGGCHCVVGAPR